MSQLTTNTLETIATTQPVDKLLATDSLVKEYHHLRVVNGVLIKVAPDEIVGLLGSNDTGNINSAAVPRT